ncbi:hypothetical protein D9757_003718 [Collybiopsis confluens]|uniref:DUF726-domain-containing protein n=1 Tax=Collybiopsis confluens TaxID=2823264 RepID=A0A8H5HV68_9AGAR|nr:hypothetical protein D9757_003718 [Collybiopsis confluens]
MTSSDLQELTLIGHAIYHNLLDLIVLTTGYGTLLLGIFIASHSLISKSWTRSRIVLVACLAVIFICFTLEVFGVGMVGNLIGAWLDLVQTTPGSKGGLEGQALKTKNIILPLNYTSVWLIMIIYLDVTSGKFGIDTYRFVKLALVILMFIDIVINITDSTFDSIPIPRPVVSAESRAILADCLASVLSMVVNIFATGLVAWKAWQVTLSNFSARRVKSDQITFALCPRMNLSVWSPEKWMNDIGNGTHGGTTTMTVSLEKIAPPTDLTDADQTTLFQYIIRRLAAYRNSAQLHALAEYSQSSLSVEKRERRKAEFDKDINEWAQGLVEKAYMVCGQPEGGQLPSISPDRLQSVLNAVLFLSITTTKQYSARTRSFLLTNFPNVVPDEELIVMTLKHPDKALEEAQQKAEASTKHHASKSKTLRMVGMGAAAVAGGVLVGVTGGLAAPLIGASITTIFGWLGVGGTAAGLLASGLAGSSAVCGALFGVYGAKTSASMIQRHTREIRDLAIVPVTPTTGSGRDETLGVRLCISGWLSSEADVAAPWAVFEGEETLALQWEVEALEQLSDALYTLIKTNAMKYVRAEIIRRTVFASVLAALGPMALLKVGEIIDNPWMNTKALALKAGAVLGDLLAKRVFGNRPVTLIGYSFGSLVILEALKRVASLPPSETSHLIQDVYLFGTPASTDPAVWSSVRRLVSGRLVNGYASKDFVLAILSRASDISWQIAGLHPVDVQGVENVHFEEIDGHTKWRVMIGKCLKDIGASGINNESVDAQLKNAIRENTI